MYTEHFGLCELFIRFISSVFDIVCILGDNSGKRAIRSQQCWNEAVSMKQWMSNLIRCGCWKTRKVNREILETVHLWRKEDLRFLMLWNRKVLKEWQQNWGWSEARNKRRWIYSNVELENIQCDIWVTQGLFWKTSSSSRIQLCKINLAYQWKQFLL